MSLNRRAFLAGGFAALGYGFLGTGCCLVPAPKGWKAAGRPNLKFGVVSDVHIGLKDATTLNPKTDTATFKATLEWFREQGADAVMIAGDIADRGMVREMEAAAAAWREVFPNDRAPDGRPVAKLFVTGNHDWDGWTYGNFAEKCYPTDTVARAKNVLQTDMKANWERIWGEPYAHFWVKTVKGYTFLGQHWEEKGRSCFNAKFAELAPWLEKNGASVAGTKPFFYVQHPHLKDTVFGPTVWGHDAGLTTAALSRFPNAVAFSGHSHFSLTDQRDIWQGAFTAVGTSSLRYTGSSDESSPGEHQDHLHEDGIGIMPHFSAWDGRQCLLVSVYDDAIVYARRDAYYGRSLGPDWIQPLPAAEEKTFGFAERAKAETGPAFPTGAEITVKDLKFYKPRCGQYEKGPAIELAFPPANAGGVRPFEYRVTVTGDAKPFTTYVYAQGFNMPLEDARASGPTKIVLMRAALPAKGGTVTVTPVTSLGTPGTPLSRFLS